jgi:hypothetical protein
VKPIGVVGESRNFLFYLPARPGVTTTITRRIMNAKVDEQVEEEVETETDDKGTGTDQTKTGKTFTQEDVNKLIAKEKASWKRGVDKEKETWTTAEQTLREQLTARDEIIQKNVDLLKKDLNIDEEDWELTMADRDVLFQYDYLLKKVEKLSKKDIPRTPKGEGERNEKFTFTRRNTV